MKDEDGDEDEQDCYCTSCLISDRNNLKEVIGIQEKIISDLISDKMISDAELTPYMKDIKRRYTNDLEEKERIYNHKISIYSKNESEQANKIQYLEAENRLLNKRCEELLTKAYTRLYIDEININN